jgi:DNA-binding response OmpR family regulator
MSGSKILIVEDDRNLLEVLKYNLAKEGHDVITASDGVEALGLARDNKPDLIVLDIMLPKLDGFEVCRILRREMTMPILMLTSRGSTLIDLSPKEFDLLALLVKNREQVFSRDQLLEKVWGYDYAGDTRTVDVHVRWLRQKIEYDPANPKHLLTVRGIGYKFEG